MDKIDKWIKLHVNPVLKISFYINGLKLNVPFTVDDPYILQ